LRKAILLSAVIWGIWAGGVSYAAAPEEVFVKPAIADAAAPFPLSNVRLLPGPFKSAEEIDAKYLLSLDPDRLLHVFRLNAGLPTSAQPLGGWEDPKCELRGHFVGHYLSACAQMYAATGDELFKQRVDYMVGELGKCQEALGDGYLSAFPTSYFDRLEAGEQVWAPYYTIHKIMAGLFDANQLCGNRQALEMASGMAGYFKRRTDKLSDEQMQRLLNTEFGGIMEVLANLYGVTGNPDELALAKRFDHHAVFDPLARHEDRLAGLHANTQIPKMTGAARLYELTGEERYGAVPTCFWEAVTMEHSFVNGGNSFAEHFRRAGIEATALVPTTAETCNTYNMLKLTRHLFAWEPKPYYMDYYERALFNHILASIDPDTGMTMYFFSLQPGHFKVYCTPTNSFWCCTGTGVENHAEYGEAIYAHGVEGDQDALFVNLFIASTLNWPEEGLKVEQKTNFPREQGTTLTVHAESPVRMAVKLRIPSWTRGAGLKINGQAQSMALPPGSYATIDRQWRDGDRIELSLPMSLHLYHASDNPRSVAIMDGPIVLAGKLGRNGMPSSDQATDQNQYNKVTFVSVPELQIDPNADPARWLKPAGGDDPLAFTTANFGMAQWIEVAPLYEIHHERYTVYWEVEPR
jgi:DUF1680 family protein